MSPQAVFATPMRLPNVSSQCVFAYPMRLRNASAPPNASSQCVCASQGVCAFQCVFGMRLRLLVRLRRLDLFLTNASSQRGCVFRSSATLRQDAAVYVYTYIYVYAIPTLPADFRTKPSAKETTAEAQHPELLKSITA